jgi:hypothetical protein
MDDFRIDIPETTDRLLRLLDHALFAELELMAHPDRGGTFELVMRTMLDGGIASADLAADSINLQLRWDAERESI